MPGLRVHAGSRYLAEPLALDLICGKTNQSHIRIKKTIPAKTTLTSVRCAMILATRKKSREIANKSAARAHGADVGGDVDGVGNQQQQYKAVQQPRRVVATDVGRQPAASHAADARAHGLDADHERKSEKSGPEYRVSELSTNLRIGGNAARIVVRGARYEAGAERPE